MTTVPEFEQPEPLPGLEAPGPANVSPLVRALRRTVAQLHRDELLNEGHALDLEACRLLARSAEYKLASGRASTIANDVDLMLRIRDGIVHPAEGAAGGVDEQLRAALEEFNRALDGASPSG